MTKRAFVVGINDYHNWQRTQAFSFPDLHWCVADASAFASMLTDSFGFVAENVVLCQDAEATLQAVLDGITHLFSLSEPGDTACVYFAGYGGRMPANGWQLASNYYYDVIVPYDGAGMVSDQQLVALTQGLL